MPDVTVTGQLVDVHSKEIYPATIEVIDGVISKITRLNNTNEGHGYILPGFVDSHVHIESSMLVPSEFAKLAVVHGTVATVSDPHEIANVCGVEGVDYMIANGNTVPFKFHFGAPSCVPATIFETAGDALNSHAVATLLARDDIYYLSEMMNFPGVLQHDQEVMAKIASAKAWHKPIDGHAPGLRGDEAKTYINAGISTDHECFSAEEAVDKLRSGMKILIREGSAAKNFDALINLLHDHEDEMMFCSDDKHPDSLEQGHIDQLCARAAARGIDVFKIIKAACVNPVLHYKMTVGLLREGDPADFIIVKDLKEFKTVQTYIDGRLVANDGQSLISSLSPSVINNFECELKTPDLFIYHSNESLVDVIEALDGQLITNRIRKNLPVVNGAMQTDIRIDVLKIVVVNRYQSSPAAISFISNFGLKAGALASSVAHDSHNIVAVGVDDEAICKAVNLIINAKGGVSAVSLDKNMLIALPIAGLMSDGDGYEVAKKYTAIDKFAKDMGSTLSAPFMTLSFMALLVIPHLKLSDKGLFDGDSFTFVHDK